MKESNLIFSFLGACFDAGNPTEQEVQTFDVNGQLTDSNFTIIVF